MYLRRINRIIAPSELAIKLLHESIDVLWKDILNEFRQSAEPWVPQFINKENIDIQNLENYFQTNKRWVTSLGELKQALISTSKQTRLNSCIKTLKEWDSIVTELESYKL